MQFLDRSHACQSVENPSDYQVVATLVRAWICWCIHRLATVATLNPQSAEENATPWRCPAKSWGRSSFDDGYDLVVAKRDRSRTGRAGTMLLANPNHPITLITPKMGSISHHRCRTEAPDGSL